MVSDKICLTFLLETWLHTTWSIVIPFAGAPLVDFIGPLGITEVKYGPNRQA